MERHDLSSVLTALDLTQRKSEELNATIKKTKDDVKKEVEALGNKVEKVSDEIVQRANQAIKVKVDQRLHYKAVILTAISCALIALALGLYLGGKAPYEFYKATLLASLVEQEENFKEATKVLSSTKAEYEQKLATFEKEKTKAINSSVDRELKAQKAKTRELDRELKILNSLVKASFDANSQILVLQLKDDYVQVEHDFCADLIHHCLIIKRNTKW